MTRRIVTAISCTLLVLVISSPAEAVDTDGQYRVAVWGGHEFKTHLDPNTLTCSPEVTVFGQEMQTSGITRLKLWYQQYSHYSPKWDLLSFETTDYAAWGPFPNDDDSYYVSATLPRGLWNEPVDSGRKVAVRFVGERPSFWSRDVSADYNVGEINCDQVPDPNSLVTTAPPKPSNIIPGGGKAFNGGHGN